MPDQPIGIFTRSRRGFCFTDDESGYQIDVGYLHEWSADLQANHLQRVGDIALKFGTDVVPMTADDAERFALGILRQTFGARVLPQPEWGQQPDNIRFFNMVEDRLSAFERADESFGGISDDD